MIPTLIEIGPFPIRSFGLMVALALFAGAIRLGKSFARYGIDARLAERYVTAAGISGILGARLWYIGENWAEFSDDLLSALLASAGFTFYGGFVCATAVVYIMARRDGVPMARFCDALGPALALGYAVGRLGCQLSGDGDYGVRTTSWWGMSYATGVVPTLPGELVYPTPFFESMLALGMLFILLRVEQSTSVLVGRLQRFGLYLVLLSAERFSIEFFRINPAVVGSLSEAQAIAISLAGVGLIFLIVGRGSKGAGSTCGSAIGN